MTLLFRLAICGCSLLTNAFPDAPTICPPLIDVSGSGPAPSALPEALGARVESLLDEGGRLKVSRRTLLIRWPLVLMCTRLTTICTWPNDGTRSLLVPNI